jgi:hypothetical protein
MSVLFRKFAKAVPQPITKEGVKATIGTFYTIPLLDVVKDLVAKKHSEKTFLEMLQLAFPMLNVYYPNRASLSVKLSEIRKVIKANQPAEAYKKSTHDEFFNLPETERNELKTNYANKVIERNQDLIQIDPSQIMEKLATIKDSVKPYEQGVLLMVCSGMRPIELFKNIVEPIDTTYANFSNLAKKRGKTEFTVKRPILLLTTNEFITKLAQFKEYFANKVIFEENGRLSANIITHLNKYTRKIFPNIGEEGQASSMLRKYYAVLSYEMFADKKKTNFNVWIKNVLGHDDLNTSFAYSTINLSPEEKEERDEEKREIVDNSPLAIRVYQKLPRMAPEADKMKLLLKIYNDFGGSVSNAILRTKSGLGSRIVNSFLMSR